jgi:hypothetical protein
VSVLVHDVRFALRSLKKAPGVTVLAVLTLALGTGANTAIFSVIDALLLQPPRFEHLDRLVSAWEVDPTRRFNDVPVSQDNFVDWRTQNQSLEYITGWRNWYFTLASQDGGEPPDQVRGVRVSPVFFKMFGIKPALGRTFRDDEGEPGADRVVVFGHGLWMRRFGGDPGIVGRRVLLDAEPYTVIGVLPRDFYFLQPDFEMWIPLTMNPELVNQADHSLAVFARLKAGVSIEAARSDFDVIARRLEQLRPETNTGGG